MQSEKNGEIWVFVPYFFCRYFKKFGIAAVLLELKPRPVINFQECRLTAVSVELRLVTNGQTDGRTMTTYTAVRTLQT